MKYRNGLARIGAIAGVSLALVACSHEKTQSEQERSNQQAGQAQQKQSAGLEQSQAGSQAQTQATAQHPNILGEQSVTSGSAQIQRQKKVVSTVIVREKIPTVKESTIRADINKMNAKQFTAIGFPSDVANNIVQYRDRNGPFHSVDDLASVDGVSQSLIDRYGSYLGVNQSAAASSQAGQAGQTGQTDQSGMNQ